MNEDINDITLESWPCICGEPDRVSGDIMRTSLHLDIQDKECRAWKALIDLIELTLQENREEFSPSLAMSREDWRKIVTLPADIGKLKTVRKMDLYGSNISRIPPEIGEMVNLEEFIPYTSYRLHWFPYEITKCTKLKDTCVSTRALYGNIKHRPPFPALHNLDSILVPRNCSICNSPLSTLILQRWVSLWVGTDVVPLLVHACSELCLDKLPTPPADYVRYAHSGGPQITQPKALYDDL